MLDDIDALLAQADTCLNVARARIAAEIAAYPTPISGCDAQFNHLLAQRAKIGAGLAALRVEVFVPTPRTPSAAAGVESR